MSNDEFELKASEIIRRINGPLSAEEEEAAKARDEKITRLLMKHMDVLANEVINTSWKILFETFDEEVK